MKYILLIGAFESFVFAFLLYGFKEKKHLSDSILSLFFMVLSLSMFLVFMDGYNRENGFKLPFLLFTGTPLLLLHGPLLGLYVQSLTEQHFRFKPIQLLHFLPFLAMLAQHSLELFCLPSVQKISIAIHEDFVHYRSYPIFLGMILLSPLAYFSWGLMQIKKHNTQLKNYFSKLNDINLNWLRTLLLSSLTFYSFVNLLFIVSLFVPFIAFNKLQMASFAFSTLYILFLGFYGRKQINLFSSHAVPIELENLQPIQVPEELNDSDKLFIDTLLNTMKTKKPFLNPELNLTSLSTSLLVSPEYLSSTLNSRLNLNFYDFINHYRIEEFKTECLKPQNKEFTILAIAYNCGFNSKATFNRVFRNATGCTPSEYIKESQRN